MFLRVKIVNSNKYFYLVETQRVKGKQHPVQRNVKYLGAHESAIAQIEKMNISPAEKTQLIAKIKSIKPLPHEAQQNQDLLMTTCKQKLAVLGLQQLDMFVEIAALLSPLQNYISVYDESQMNSFIQRIKLELSQRNSELNQTLNLQHPHLNSQANLLYFQHIFSPFCYNQAAFWEEQISKVEELSIKVGDPELTLIFHMAPVSHMWDLLHNRPDTLLEYLQSLKQEMNKAAHKLSKKQREILLQLFVETIGTVLKQAQWVPTKLLQPQPEANFDGGCSPVFSRALKRLEDRNLVIRRAKQESHTNKRTKHVEFSHLGMMVTRKIWLTLSGDEQQRFANLRNRKLANG